MLMKMHGIMLGWFYHSFGQVDKAMCTSKRTFVIHGRPSSETIAMCEEKMRVSCVNALCFSHRVSPGRRVLVVALCRRSTGSGECKDEVGQV